ncbi:hypothetical protein [Spirillospora sp. NPDC047279]|uniref:hypothetical protein n=1 Tax=Spirillospora sp. NPDC047279 TaxID=3155478 RepID=UPI0033D6A0C1
MSNVKALPIVARLTNYDRQNAQLGRKDYTAAQGRRLRKTYRRYLKAKRLARERLAVQVQVDTSDFTEKLTPAVTRPCGGVDHCVTTSGAKARATHKKCETAA